MSGESLQVNMVPHGSAEYLLAVQLRREVLRWPLGLEFSQSELDDESGQFHLVATDGGDLIGCLCLVPLDDGALKMRQVAVAPAWQGKGVGRLLVRASEELGREKGFRVVRLHARESAVPFYLKLGYRVDGEQFEEVGIPHFAMEKALG